MVSKRRLRRRIKVLEPLIDEKLATHPWPWKIEHDWTFEVLDANRNVVIKYSTYSEARTFLAMGRRRQLNRERGDLFCAAFEKSLLDDDPDAMDRVLQKPWKEWRT